MTNAEVIKDLGIELSGNIDEDNKIVNKALGIGLSEKFVKYVKVGDKHKKVSLTPRSFELGFCEQVWSQLDLGEKLKLMKWASEDFLQKNGYGTDFPEFVYFCKNNYENLNFAALAFEKNIFISLEHLNKMSGYDAVILALHESIHELDFVEISKIMQEEISQYIFNYSGVDNFRTIKEILKLPIKGKIINWKTGQYEYVTDDLREKILLCKNKLIKCSLYKNTPTGRRMIYTSADFDKYLSSDFYYCSPLENKAYNKSIWDVFEMSYRNSKIFGFSKNDVSVLDYYYNYLNKLNGRKLEIQKQFKMPISEALNMEFEHIFNKMYFGDNKVCYICQDHMQKREQMVKRFWDLKHAGKGKYKEGATEQIK